MHCADAALEKAAARRKSPENTVPIINSILDGSCTSDFKPGVVITLLKDERSYRPVALLETLWKTAMTRVSDRLLDTLQKFSLLNDAHYAFVRNGGIFPPSA